MQKIKAERITITLPPNMLTTIKEKVSSGLYSSTSEVIREAVRVWQQKEEERQVRLLAIRERLEHSAQSGESIPIEMAFKEIEDLHKQQTKTALR